MPVSNIYVSQCTFTKLITTQKTSVGTSCTAFYSNWSKNADNVGKNLIYFLHKVRLELHQFSTKLKLAQQYHVDISCTESHPNWSR